MFNEPGSPDSSSPNRQVRRRSAKHGSEHALDHRFIVTDEAGAFNGQLVRGELADGVAEVFELLGGVEADDQHLFL